MNMIDYDAIIYYLYPSILETDFELSSDGISIYISKWNSLKLGSQPTIDYLTNNWLPIAKEIKKEEIKNITLSELNDGVSGYTVKSIVNGFTINSSRSDLSNLQNLYSYTAATVTSQLKLAGVTDQAQIDLAIAAYQITFKDFTNNFHLITLGDLASIIYELQAYVLWLYQHKWEKEQEIDAATDLIILNNISW